MRALTEVLRFAGAERRASPRPPRCRAGEPREGEGGGGGAGRRRAVSGVDAGAGLGAPRQERHGAVLRRRQRAGQLPDVVVDESWRLLLGAAPRRS